MDGKTTKSSVSSGELEVQRVRPEEIESAKRMGEYDDMQFGGIDLEVTGNEIGIKDPNGGSSDSANTGKKTSGYLRTGNSIIMKFKEKIQDIINGVTLKVKGDKDKDKEETGSKKVVKKAPGTKPGTDDHEK